MNDRVPHTVTLICGHLKHITTLSSLGVGGVLVLVELGVFQLSGYVIAAMAFFALGAMLGVEFERIIIFRFSDEGTVHPQAKQLEQIAQAGLGLGALFLFLQVLLNNASGVA